jgi:hypothetical protein
VAEKALKAADDFEAIRAQVVELFADAQAHIVSVPAPVEIALGAPVPPAPQAPVAPQVPVVPAPPTAPLGPQAPSAVPPPPPPAGTFLTAPTSHIKAPGSDPIEAFAPPPQMDWGPARTPRLLRRLSKEA